LNEKVAEMVDGIEEQEPDALIPLLKLNSFVDRLGDLLVD
jgi:hypothetical protein